MATGTIKLGQLTDELSRIYKEYSDEVIKAMPEAAKKAADVAVKSLKANAPKDTGKYAKSFKKETTKNTSSATEITVYSTVPGLTHLLERGHPVKNQYGGPYGTAKAFPHWAPAEEEANKTFEEEIRKAVEGIS